MEEDIRAAVPSLPKDKADLLMRIQREWSALMQTFDLKDITVRGLATDQAKREIY